MRSAITLAARGAGRTSPNPVVGAVIVKSGRVVAEGFHRKAGGPHAEAAALANLKAAGGRAKGADVYVTLEPCSHHGRTPPCVDGLIEAGVRRVFVGMADPNPLVAGSGMKRLRAAGIEVVSGVLEDECRALNPAFIKYITTKTPYVTVKLAASLDGRIAVAGGQSRWITGEAARRYVHRLRALSDAVLTGRGTVAKDDPAFTVRDCRGLNPLRVLLDTAFRTPLGAAIFKSSPTDRFPYPAMVFTTLAASRAKITKAEALGIEVVVVRKGACGVDINAVMAELGRREVTSVLAEGGGAIAASLLKAGAIDRVSFHVAPIIIGSDGVAAVGGLGLKAVSGAPRLKRVSVKRLGSDTIIEGDVSSGDE
ncbi:MAG: bifunctional diaminohydroxyphosphoribosylaminopyrimidine deaminase/5-amino-6-(5-phosphoribosylamino)uracil reductase RibD [Deltaproteobacteria bacterium]|nr:bifunctional diaminohydroxyphosphoribosylaminopyrimidine deaminase/5-amino-6-(5-phosphoribosylamino)uracil reductase RibD [Deltaproteobacteria bacterium]